MVETSRSKGLFDQYCKGLGKYGSIEEMILDGVSPMTWEEWCALYETDQKYFANSSDPTFGKRTCSSGCPKKGSF